MKTLFVMIVGFVLLSATVAFGQKPVGIVNNSFVRSECGFSSIAWVWDFSQGHQGFTTGDCDTEGLPVWEWGTESVEFPAMNVWGTVLNGPYTNLSGEALISPIWTVGPDSYLMEVVHYYDIETSYDGVNVKINGQVIEPIGGYPDDELSDSTAYYAWCVDSEPGFTGHDPVDFFASCFNLSDFLGQEVQMEFQFGSDDSVTYPGWYLANITVGSDYVQPTGTIMVDPDPNELNAPWQLVGPDGYVQADSGDQILLNLPLGEYVLTWGEVVGWITPEPNPVALVLPDDGTITFSGLYIEAAEIGDWVWWDENGNGIQDPGEHGTTAYVVLYDSQDNQIDWTWSDEWTGHYYFTGLFPGEYYLTFQGLADDMISPWDVGDDDLDSDMNLGLGRTAIFTLTAGQIDHSWDCGFFHDASGIEDEVIPVSYVLHSNIPNPFNPQTTIAFELPERESVTLRVFDMSGRLVRVLVDSELHSPGRHEVVWNGRDDTGRQVASGTYFYRLEAGSLSETKRMVLIK